MDMKQIALELLGKTFVSNDGSLVIVTVKSVSTMLVGYDVQSVDGVDPKLPRCFVRRSEFLDSFSEDKDTLSLVYAEDGREAHVIDDKDFVVIDKDTWKEHREGK